MKIDRHSPTAAAVPVKLRLRSLATVMSLVVVVGLGCRREVVSGPDSASDERASASDDQAFAGKPAASNHTAETSQSQATKLLRMALQQIANGPPFVARVRETVWATGREVVGVGSYEQAGSGTGQFNLQITMHDGDGQHQFKQISDGRLAWTRTEVAKKVALRRVDVGRLDEWVTRTGLADQLAPRLRIGGLTEMLDTVDRDYVNRARSATLSGRRVWVVTGKLRRDVRRATQEESGRSQWPALFPTAIRVVIAGADDPETGIGMLLPVRLEYYSDPVSAEGDLPAQTAQGRLITMIELYSLQPIDLPPIERFRFDNQQAEVNFSNDTERYLHRFGVQLTESQRKTLRR